jgi:hypothetical protein
VARGELEVTVDDSGLKDLMKVVRQEADAKQLRKDLIAEIRTAVAPGVSAVQAKVRAIPHSSAAHPKPAMSSYLASRVKPQVRLSGRSAGVRVRIGTTPNLRGFAQAARRLNRKFWRHQVYGNKEVWVEQRSPIPGFFDDTLAAGRDSYRAAVVTALKSLADRLTVRKFGGL